MYTHTQIMTHTHTHVHTCTHAACTMDHKGYNANEVELRLCINACHVEPVVARFSTVCKHPYTHTHTALNKQAHTDAHTNAHKDTHKCTHRRTHRRTPVYEGQPNVCPLQQWPLARATLMCVVRGQQEIKRSTLHAHYMHYCLMCVHM